MLHELGLLLVRWRPAFPRHVTWVRVVGVLLGLVVATGRRTVTASIAVRGRQFEPWAPDYLAFSRAPWQVPVLFDGVVDATLEARARFCQSSRYLLVAVDDTTLRKTGKRIAAARWGRDPMSPPFHVNLRWGLRYLHMAAILPLQHHGLDPRAVSVAFAPAPAVKKPGKRATDQQRADFKVAQKQNNLSCVAVREFEHLRRHLDESGHRDLWVLALGDGSYTNSNVLPNLPERTEYLGRARGDMVLHAPAPAGGRKVYGDRLPTPNQVRQDDQAPWTQTELFYAGEQRRVRYKVMPEVLWPRGAKRRRLRVLIVAPTPYRAPGRGKKRWYYRDPAYLVTTDLTTAAEELIQAYLARWQIEVEHRDLKTGLGVGQAQVWNDKAVERFHAAHVAFWSMVKLAALNAHGLWRSADYPPRPAWYPQEPDDRASQADIVEALKADLQRHAPPSPGPRPPRPKTVRRAPLRRRLARERLLEAA